MDQEMRDFISGALQGAEDRTAALILAEVSTLRLETQRGLEKVDRRLDSIDSRMKLQAGLVQTGARAMARLVKT